jgi:hypothetical protein
MTLPLQFANTQPSVVKDSTNESIAMFLKSMAGIQEQQNFERQMEAKEEELKQQREAMEAKKEHDAQVGAGLQKVIASQEQQPAQIPAEAMQMMMPGAEAWQATGRTAFGEIVAQMPVGAISEFVKQSAPMRAEAAGSRAIEATAAKLPQAMRGDFTNFAKMKQTGIDIPNDMLPSVFPSLYAKMEGLDPTTSNAVTRMLMAGMNVGEVKASGLRGTEAIKLPDNFTLPDTGSQTKMSEQQANAIKHLSTLEMADATIDELSASVDKNGNPKEPVYAGVTSQVLREVNARASGSPLFGLITLIPEIALRASMSQDQKVLFDAQMAMGTNFVYVLSGATATGREFSSLFSSYMQITGDGPDNIAKKTAIRKQLIEAVRTVAAGGSRATALDSIIKNAHIYGISDAALADFKTLREKARLEDVRPSAPVLTREPVDPASPITYERIKKLIEDNTRKAFIMSEP